jgi:hypothetical protein
MKISAASAAQLLRRIAREAIRVVALGQLGEPGADVGVAGLVADAEDLERVQLAQRLELRGQRRHQIALGGADVLAPSSTVASAHRGIAPLVLGLGRGQRGLDQPQRALGDGR